MIDRQVRKGFLLALLASMAFAFYGPATRGAYADGVSASFIILFTTFWRAASLGAETVRRRQSLFATADARRMACIGGFAQALSIIGILGALAYLPAPVMQTMLFFATIILMLLAVAKGEARLNAANILTTGVTIIALTFVVNVWHVETTYSASGYALGVLAVLATAGRVYVYGHQTKTRDPVVVGAESFLVAFGLLLLLLLFLPLDVPGSSAGWFYAVLAALSLVLGTFGMLYSLSLIGSFRFSLMAKSEVMFNAVISVLLLGEMLEWHQYAGMAIAAVTLALYQVYETRQKAQQA